MPADQCEFLDAEVNYLKSAVSDSYAFGRLEVRQRKRKESYD